MTTVGLTDILLEASASEEAERMGLERKPGFGNYGPPGDDTVTHRSRGGQLVPVGDTKGQGVGRGAGKAKPSGRVTTRPKDAPKPLGNPTPPKKTPKAEPPAAQAGPSSFGATLDADKKARADGRRERSLEKGGPRKLAKLLDIQPDLPFKNDIVPTFGTKMTRGKEMVTAIGKLMGVSTDEVLVNDLDAGGEPHRQYEQMAQAGIPFALGAFHTKARSIWVHPKQRDIIRQAMYLPPSLWTPEMSLTQHILIHEGVHSTSPRLQADGLVTTARGGGLFGVLRKQYGNPVVLCEDTLSVEEGLTEYIARYMTKHAMEGRGVNPDYVTGENMGTYDEWVKGIRLMVAYGGLDPVKTFQTMGTAEDLRAVAQKSEDTVLTDLLSRELGLDDHDVSLFLKEMHRKENRESKPSVLDYDPWIGEFHRFQDKSLAIMNPNFQRKLERMLELVRSGNFEQLPDNISFELLHAL